MQKSNWIVVQFNSLNNHNKLGDSMKNLCTFFFLFVVLLFTSTTINAGSKTIVDDVLIIPYASEAPEIDGQLDDIWLNVTSIPMLLTENIPDTVMPYDDHYAEFRAMWDEEYFYVLVQVVDDSLFAENASAAWLNDCIELFFDGDNAKASSYDDNDIQLHWNYGETPDNHPISPSASIGEWIWAETSSGYNFEIRLSAADLALYFPLEADQEIGFEISNGDLESSISPQLVLHWWTTDGLTWNNPSLFGTAILSENEVSSILEIPFTSDAPTIDGQMNDDEGWIDVLERSLTKHENGVDGNFQDSIYVNWMDHQASFWTMWDNDYFYAFVKVVDDSVFAENATAAWLNDCVEIFIDGDNAKASSYDENDIQWHWNYGETPDNHPISPAASVGEWAWADTELGYNFELRIPKDTIQAFFSLETDQEIGFEISNGDLESANSPQTVLHWWTNNGLTWNNPSLFGTALLVGGGGTDIGDDNSVVTDYQLKQNYPNPFNPTTKISYSIASSEKVNLTVYNLFGEEVATLVNQNQPAGEYAVNFDASQLASGVYFYKLNVGNKSLVRKMMLLK